MTHTVSVRHCSRASLGTAGGKVPLAHGCDACGRAFVPELPRRCGNGRLSTEAVAASAVRARPESHGAADHLHRSCVAAGRPAVSDDETDVHCVRQWLAQCGQLARSSAAPRGSRVHAGAKAALRGLSTRSELARQALKSSVAKHGQFLEGPSLRQKRQNSQSICQYSQSTNDLQQKGAFRCSPAPLFETRAALARQELLTKVPVDERQKEHTARNGNGDETQWPSRGRVADDGAPRAPTSDDESAR